MKTSKKLLRVLTLVLAVAMLMVAFAGCGGDAAKDEASGSGKTKVVVGINGKFESLTPVQNGNDRYGAPVSDHIYEVLAEADEGGSAELIGVLLKEWSSEDGITYDCTLYEGIKDSEGNAFTAEDVQFAMNTAKEKSILWSPYIEEVIVEDETNFQLVLTTNSPGVFDMVASQIKMFTQEAYEASDNGLANAPIGTGPYVCTHYTAEDKVVLEKNENYWRTEAGLEAHPNYQANVDVVEFQMITESTQLALALESGDVQVGFWINTSVIEQLEGIEGLVVEAGPHWSSRCYYFDMSEGSMFENNLNLRLAVIHAIDGESIMKAITKGYGDLSYALGNNTQIGYNEAWEDYGYSYDLDKAKEYFEAAKEQLIADGYDPNNLTMRWVCYNNAEEPMAAELIQAQLKELGITLEIYPSEGAAYNTAIDAENDQFEIAAANGNFGSYITTFWATPFDASARESGNTRFGLNDPKLQELYATAASAEGFTQENLDAFNQYIHDNALIHQYYKLAAVCAHEDTITLTRDSKTFLRPGSFEYSEDYAHFAE